MSRPNLILHAKFAAYLGWSQPFLHRLLQGLEAEAPGAVLCNRRENRERFQLPRHACVTSQALIRPAGAALVAEVLRQAWRPRLLHAHFGWSGVRSLLLRECLGIPLVTTFGGRDLGADLHDPRHHPLYARLLQASDLCLCVSEALAAELAKAGVEDARIRVVYRGADADFFQVQARDDRQPDAPVRLLMVGRLVEKKGHGDAIAALARLDARGVRGILRIVGAGSARQGIEQEATRRGLGDRVQVCEPTNAIGVREHFAWADVLVHCSRRGGDGDVEGIPNVVVEAAATGLPVVGTHHGGIPEVVMDGVTGRLVPEAEVPALADALYELAAQPEQRCALGAAGARQVRERFTLSAQIEAHLAAYDALAGSAPRAEPLPSGYTAEALNAIAPAVDADLLVASRWVRAHWTAEPAEVPPSMPAAGSVNAEQEETTSPSSSPAMPPAPLRERLRQLGAAWAEWPWFGIPMRAYRVLRRARVAAAQQREDVGGWKAIAQGLRPDVTADGARSAIRHVLRELPTGALPAAGQERDAAGRQT
ncbi:MAG: glycosyltransferase family 4 protein [Deltaproteobacteria bacterium]|nr:glycosyltransferase family 4 protein [Deltaproteobacteria bacterium]MBW2362074.1 glycosyltransferase family 4 protein [Deltaproteobacteria bacterium]